MDWLEGINAAVTVCDAEGTILYMNDRSGRVFADDGGKDLVGTSLFGCHPEPALAKLKDLLRTGSTNVYTIEKNGVRKLIYQAPWTHESVVGGMIEISIELPADMQHFIRT